MNAPFQPVQTAADLVVMLEQRSYPPAARKRDMISAINRVCAMVACPAASLRLEVPSLRAQMATIRPAAHGITPKTFSNIRSLFAAALEEAGLIDPMPRGVAAKDSAWAALIAAIADNKRLSTGLAAFTNWCASKGIAPAEVGDGVLERFGTWLETRTLYARPRDIIRLTPKLWNEAMRTMPGWSQTELAEARFRRASPNLRWEELTKGVRGEADAYLALRAKPDLFDDDPNAPTRPLAASTIRQQREHIRLAVSVLVRAGTPVGGLADLVEPEAFKAVLRHYLGKVEGKPNAFVVTLAKTLIDVARYQVRVSDDRLSELKTLAGKLPAVPFDLTEKNKALLRTLEDERTRARLVYLPDQLMREVKANLRSGGRLRHADAQVAVAVELLLSAPLRPQSLVALNWGRNFKEPEGRNGKLILYIPKDETKSRRRELVFEIVPELAENLRFYRREVLPKLGADPEGDLFVVQGGRRKSQETICEQITETIAKRVGLHMTPHQFRHVAAIFYLDAHPEDFQTVSDLLGHAWAKTTPDLRRLFKPPCQPHLWHPRDRSARGVAPEAAPHPQQGEERTMTPHRRLKHLPEQLWPAEDRRLIEMAYTPGDIFDDDRGPGVHLSDGTRRSIHFGWRRWLGFLAEQDPDALQLPAADRIRPERLRDYIGHLSTSMAPSSVAATVAHLYAGARLIAPMADWRWLLALKTRLQARATSEDRFDRLVPASRTLQLGIALMEEAITLPADGRKDRELQFRDGLIIAILSLWPIRRRSLAALTINRHVEFNGDGIDLLLFPEDTKAGRMETWSVPALLLPHVRCYLTDIRPRLLGKRAHDALWVGQQGTPLPADAIYSAVKRRTMSAFGAPMALHDFRRAAATFLAMDEPEKVGLTPGVLQHTSPDVGDRHYNLARGVTASRRHADTVAALRARLRSSLR